MTNMGLGTILFLVLLCIKLTGAASISWLLVFSPLIASAVLFSSTVLVLIVLALFGLE